MARRKPHEKKGLLDITFGGAGADTWTPAVFFRTGQDLPGADRQWYASQGAVATAVSLISLDCVTVTLEYFKVSASGKVSDTPLDDHPVMELLEDPNDYTVGSQFRVGTKIIDLVFGEAFWSYPHLVVRQGGFKTKKRDNRIELLDPRSVRFRNGQWYHVANGIEHLLDPDRLTQFKRFNPYNFHRGLSKIAAVMADLAGDQAAAEWNARFFSNQNGIPSGVIAPPAGATVTPDQRSQILRLWNQRHGRKRSVGMLPGGWTFQDLGLGQRDMDFTKLRAFSREQIFSAFGVPPFLAGILENADYANAKKQEEMYWQGTIARELGLFVETMNFDFLPKIGVHDVRIIPKWEAINQLVEDIGAKTNVAEAWFKLGLSKRIINERLEMGWDAKEIEDYDQGYLPTGFVRVEDVGKEEEPTEEPTEPTDDEPQEAPPEEPDPDAVEEDDVSPEPIQGKGSAEEFVRAAIWKTLVSQVEGLFRPYSARVRSHFKALEQEVLSNVPALLPQAAGISKVTDDDFIAILFDTQAANLRLIRSTSPLYAEAFERGGASLIAEVGVGIRFDMDDPLVTARLEMFRTRVVGINATVDKQLRGLIVAQLRAGTSQQQLTRAIKEQFGFHRRRAGTIARTEMGMAFNDARNTTMQQNGIQEHEWLSSRDQDVRDSHRDEDGNKVQIGSPFPVTQLTFPQDPGGKAEEVINCRCVALAVTPKRSLES